MKDADRRLVERVERLAKHRALTLEFADVELACRLAFVEEQRANEQEKRARHAEAERDAFNTRIGELETELRELRSRVGVCGGRRQFKKHIVAWLRVVADHVEKGGSPYVFASDVPDRAPDKPCNEETIETFSVVLSKPWGG